jgi:hypothetical protein
MTATVFVILLVCLLAMRFFFTCLIVILIGVFVLSDQPARAIEEPSGCEPIFVRMNAELIHATVACNKNYMDTTIGNEIAELSSICYHTIGVQKSTAIARDAMLNWDKIAKEKGKKEACTETNKLFNTINDVYESTKKN